MQSPLSADVVRFFCPNSERTNLYVTSILVTYSEDEVYGKLDRLFSTFGLIYEIQVFNGDRNEVIPGETNKQRYYAFVKFYCPRDASTAREAVNKKYMIQGNLLKVAFSRRKVQLENYPLSYSKCCSLANHYLGFNGWSTKIDQIYEDKDHGEPSMVRFLTATKLEIPKHGIVCDGIGLADEMFKVGDLRKWSDPEVHWVSTVSLSMAISGLVSRLPNLNTGQEGKGRLEAYKGARKISFRRAMENAFQQIALVVLSNGKVSVQLCPEKPDEMVFLDDQIRKELVEVKNLDEDEFPEENDNTDIPAEGTELDAINEELLLDLLVDV